MDRINQKGQAFEVFRILIGSIIGLAIVVIIYSLITQTALQKEYLEDSIFYKKIEMSINNPTGTYNLIDNVNVKSGTSINNEYLGNRTGIGKNCFNILNPNNSNISYFNNGTTGIVFKKDLKLNFSIKCYISNQEDCKIKCEIQVVN